VISAADQKVEQVAWRRTILHIAFFRFKRSSSRRVDLIDIDLAGEFRMAAPIAGTGRASTPARRTGILARREYRPVRDESPRRRAI